MCPSMMDQGRRLGRGVLHDHIGFRESDVGAEGPCIDPPPSSSCSSPPSSPRSAPRALRSKLRHMNARIIHLIVPPVGSGRIVIVVVAVVVARSINGQQL